MPRRQRPPKGSFASPDEPTIRPLLPASLPLIAAALTGVALGVGLFTFVYGEGISYFGTQPEVCANCHIMWPQYESWVASSHRRVATCNDCHLPHAFVPKYVSKADNGFFHSWAFTFQDFHEPIRIKARNLRILQRNCIYCHEGVVDGLLPSHDSHVGLIGTSGDPMWCFDCHFSVGHAGNRRPGRERYDQPRFDPVSSEGAP